MKQIMKKRPQNAFQLGIKHLSWAMIVVIIVIFPIVSAPENIDYKALLTAAGFGYKMEEKQRVDRVVNVCGRCCCGINSSIASCNHQFEPGAWCIRTGQEECHCETFDFNS